MRVLVLGGDGMLGHKVFQRLQEGFPGTACTVRGDPAASPLARTGLAHRGAVHGGLDATDLCEISARLRGWRPAWVINCIGLVRQREEAADPAAAIAVNALLPHALAGLTAEWGGRLVHFSTDCVFDGRTGSYTEDSPTDAADLYGRTKALGEVRAAHVLTLRTSMIGRELKQFRSLLEWFLAQRGHTVRGFTRVIYAGVTTPYLARLVEAIVSRFAGLAGLFQITAPPISKYDLLVLLKEAYHLDVNIERDEREISDRSMSGDRFLRATGLPQPGWPALAAELAGDPTPYDSWRSS